MCLSASAQGSTQSTSINSVRTKPRALSGKKRMLDPDRHVLGAMSRSSADLFVWPCRRGRLRKATRTIRTAYMMKRATITCLFCYEHLPRLVIGASPSCRLPAPFFVAAYNRSFAAVVTGDFPLSVLSSRNRLVSQAD